MTPEETDWAVRIEEKLFSIEVRLISQERHYQQFVYPLGVALSRKLDIDSVFTETIHRYGATNATEVLAIPDHAFKRIKGVGAGKIKKMREKLEGMQP